MKLDDEMAYLWRAVDHDSEILESYITRTRNNIVAGEGGVAAIAFNDTQDARDGPMNDALSLLIDGATNYAIYMLDPDGYVTIWNRGAERIKGWKEAEIVGRSAQVFYTPKDIAAGKPADDLARAKARGRIEEESWRVRKDGSRFLANVTITALYSPAGALRGFGKVVRDITRQRAADRALALRESQLAAIIATVPDAMILLDERLCIRSFSRTAERLFGYTEVELVGRGVGSLLATEKDAAIFREATLPLLGYPIVGRRCDGSTFPIELAFDRMAGENAASFTAFMRDLSERQRTLDELHHLQERLAQVARVSLLGVMGSTLAHELNQPITAAVNYAEALRDQLASGKVDDLTETIDGVVNESLRAGNIVRQLRNFVSRGELDKQPCDLDILIRQTSDILTEILRENNATLALHLDHGKHLVLVERIQIQQVIINVVRNAAEAMAQNDGGVITITSHVEDDMVRVDVCDTGRGIPVDVGATLFDAFTSTKFDGLGVGLSICRTIVESHGGQISAATERGLTCVSFTVPMMEGLDDPS